MPFKSKKQMRFMFSQHPDIANRWVGEAKAKGQSPVQSKKRRVKRRVHRRKTK